jgi:arylsulfatase A-like enzyme
VPTPEGIDGLSLLKVIQQKEPQVRSSLYTAYRNTIRAVRDEEWKLIRYPQIDYTQLYHLKEDPQEINNLAEDPAYETKVEEMMQLLKTHHQATDDTLNLNPSTLVSKEYDYKTLKQTPDKWQPAYILNKYFPQQKNSK